MAALPLPLNVTTAYRGMGQPAAAQQQQPQLDGDDPFADLMPGANLSASTSAQGQSTDDNPFGDLMPAQAAASKPTASPLYDMTRSLGTGIRTGLEDIVGLPGNIDRLGSHGVKWVADKLGLPHGTGDSGIGSDDVHAATTKVIGEGYEPESTAGQYARTAGEFLPGSVMGAGKTLTNAIKFGLIPSVTSETAGQLTEGTKAEPWARFFGGLTGGIGASSLFGSAVPKTAAQTSRQAIAEATKNQKVHLPEAAMPDVAHQGYVAGKLGQVPILGDALRKSAERTSSEMGARMDDLAQGLGQTDRPMAAHGAKDALVEFQESTSRDLLKNAYDAVDVHITDPKKLTPMANLRNTMDDIRAAQAESTGTASNSVLDKLSEAYKRKGLTYKGAKELRTEVGDLLSGKITPEAGTSQPALKLAYGALTDDLKAAIHNAGGQPAKDAWSRANDLAVHVKTQRDEIAKIIGVKGDANPDAVVNRMLELASDAKSSSNLGRLRQVRSAIRQTGNPDVLDNVGASIIARMGRDPSTRTVDPTRFSPERFLTSYGKLSHDGRQALFGQTHTAHLDELALIADRHRELMRRGNPSGTGGVVTGTALLTGLYTAPISTLTTIATGKIAANILARPAKLEKFVNWARARNAVVEGAGTTGVQTLTRATHELAKVISEENGKKPETIAMQLISGEPEEGEGDDNGR